MEPEKFGRYEIRSEIGRGGMATVFCAYDPRFEREVAIKVLPQAFLHDPQFRVRFEREARTIALIEHPAIVPVYDFGEENGQPYIVMRCMTGGSLRDRIANGPMSLQLASQVIARLAPALDAAHAKGIVHRDLKPGNILFDQYGNAFLSDFGIARITQESSVATLTQGAILGTPAYMSPEQIHGDKVIDGRADIYALGVILYEMLTGVQPYRADTPGKIMMMHIMDQVPAAHGVRADLPAMVDTVIAHAMAKDPDERFRTADEMNAAFNNAIHTITGATAISRPAAPGSETMITPVGASQPISRPVHETPSQPLQAPPLADQPPAPPAKPRLIGLAITGIALAALALLVVGGLGLSSILKNLNAAVTQPPAATTALAQAPTNTSAPVILPSATYTLMPSLTPSLAWTSTATLEPSQTAAPSPSPEPTLLSLVTTGGADQIALVSGSEIWVMNIDGSDARQLTNDHISKSSLSWIPDGSLITFIAGKCVKTVDPLTSEVKSLVCFDNSEFVDSFEFSPDGTKIAIVVDRELYIVPNDFSLFDESIRSGRGLSRISTCPDMGPWTNKAYKLARWGTDSKTLAVSFMAPVGGILYDTIRYFDVSSCVSNPAAVDEFPASRFTMTSYDANPYIPNFSWNGALFALNSFRRNDGFGDLYIYNADFKKLQSTLEGMYFQNPVDGVCCYRDATWSPDGRYLMFAFQDIRAGSQNKVEVYYISYSEILPGAQFTPLTLLAELFPTAKEKPQFALRPGPNQ